MKNLFDFDAPGIIVAALLLGGIALVLTAQGSILQVAFGLGCIVVGLGIRCAITLFGRDI